MRSSARSAGWGRRRFGALGAALLAIASATAVSDASGARTGKDRRSPTELDVIVRYGPKTDRVEKARARKEAGVDLVKALQLPRAELVRVRGGGAAARGRAERRLDRNPHVQYAQPNFAYHAAAADPLLPQQWGLRNVGQVDPDAGDPAGVPGVDSGAIDAWGSGRGAGAVIAIVDTGVAKDQQDLVSNLLPGHDWVDNDSDPDDENGPEGHGTHVAGTAAAVADNGIGGAGVAPRAKILPERALDREGSGDTANIANGVVDAANRGADVINLSVEGPGSDQALEDSLAYSASRGVVNVAAAGNSHNNNDANAVTPCTSPATHLCVASIDRRGALSSFSNFGAQTVDVGAPGEDILSTFPAYQRLFFDDFESGLGNWTTTSTWNIAPPGVDGHSLQDSPPAGTSYAPAEDSQAVSNVVNLTARRGCILDYVLEYHTELGASEATSDFVDVGTTGSHFLTSFVGNDGPSFFETSLKPVEGAPVQIRLGLAADGDSNVADGAYFDNVGVECRQFGGPAAFGQLDGTSMAAPHVAGVAAILRGLFPTATPAQVAGLIKGSAVPLPSLAGNTVTGGRVDAAAAIARALARRPTCLSESALVGIGGRRISLHCTDPNGGAVTLEIAGAPAHGILGGIDQSADRVRYVPAAGFNGTDRFAYRGSDADAPSAAATVTLTVDQIRPRVTRLSMTRRRFRVRRRATAFRYRLSERSTVRIRIDRKLPGLRIGGHCRLRTAARLRAHPRARRCTVYRRAGTLKRRGRKGRNRVTFSGRIRGRALRPGAYRARVQATDRAGNRSRRRTIGFRVVRR